MSDYFGESISRDSISKLASSFNSLRESWESRQLDAYYKVIYCDALYITLKRGNNYSKEAVHVIYGVKDDNTRELLLLDINPTESSKVWSDYLVKLQKRGLNQVDLIVSDGLMYFSDEARIVYPEADIQKCVVHLQRNLLNKIRPKDKEDFGLDLKKIFNNFESSSTKEKAKEKIKKFIIKWESKYKRKLINLEKNEYINDYLTYISYPIEVRRMIYTTNSIENLNRQIRKVTKTKVSFEKEENLLDLIFMIIKDFESNNWQKYPVHNFKYWPRFTHSN
jgi:transposase-like protein